MKWLIFLLFAAGCADPESHAASDPQSNEKASSNGQISGAATNSTVPSGFAVPGKDLGARAGSLVDVGPPTVEQAIRREAGDWANTPYKHGGTTRQGIDCSSYTMVLYKELFKIELPRTAKQQERIGKKIDRVALRAGDLVFFRTKGLGPFLKKRHVGIYLGGGEFTHASTSKGVMVSSLENSYWRKAYKVARRVLGAEP